MNILKEHKNTPSIDFVIVLLTLFFVLSPIGITFDS